MQDICGMVATVVQVMVVEFISWISETAMNQPSFSAFV